jgi:hypothetical protein
MSDSERKQTRGKTRRGSRRERVLRRGRQKEEGAPQEKNGAASATGKNGGKELAGNDISSLLEMTGEEVKELLKAADDASKKIREAARSGQASAVADPEAGKEATSLIVGKINKEVQQVLESADEAAERIREEAQGEAQQLIEEARRRAEGETARHIQMVTNMTEQVLGELGAVRDRLERLQAAYDQAIASMGEKLGVDPSRVWETQQDGEPEAEEESDELRQRLGKRQPRKQSSQELEGISEGARLLALQQMMAGIDPAVIEERLKNEFGIKDPKPILDWMGVHAPKRKRSSRSKKR